MLANADLQRLLTALPGMFVLVRPDADFTVIGASADYLRATHTDESVIGRPLFEIFPDNPALADAKGSHVLRASLARVSAGGRAERMPVLRYDVRRPDDGQFEERYWLPWNSPLLDADGRLELIVHRVEEATAKASDKAVEILESITEGFFTLDRRWRFDYVNAEAHRILGVEPGSLAGRVIWEVYPGLEDTPFWHCFHLTMESRVRSSFTAHYASQARWYEATVFPAPESISIYFRNVTDRKLMEAQREALAELSQRLANATDAGHAANEGAVVLGMALNASRVGYGTVDHDSGNLVVDRDWTSPGTDSLSGVTPLSDYGTFIASLRRGENVVIGDTQLDPRTAQVADALQGRQTRSFVNVPVLERGRLVAVLFVDDDKVRDWTREEIGFIEQAAARIRTVVERATAEDEMRASEERYRLLNAELAESGRAKDEFLATLAHELRNPLAPIRNALAIQGIAGHDTAVIAQTRALMERQVVQMTRLIDDLLDVSRLSRGLVDLKIERVSLASAIGLALDASRPFIEQSAHQLAVELPGEELVVNVDPVRITQIITNLLNNAAKFTPCGGKLSITLRREGTHAQLRVRDNGIGLRADMLERVFNMFEQVDRSYAQVTGGLGIGLTLVKRLVEAQGGTVRAESEGLGNGSEFVVCLPLAQRMHDVAPQAARDVLPGRPQSPQRILIADDNEDAARSLAMLLEMSGHETRVVGDGAQAVAAMDEFQPHVAILDIAMPVLDGLHAARAIRASPRGDQVLLIALSGFGQPADRQRSLAAGLDEHLVKPVDLRLVDRLVSANPYRFKHARR